MRKTIATLFFLAASSVVGNPELEQMPLPREIHEYHNLKIGDKMPVFSIDEYAPLFFGELSDEKRHGYFIALGRINVYTPANFADGDGFYAPDNRWAYMEEAVDCYKNPFAGTDIETGEAYIDRDGIINIVVPVSDTNLFNYAPSCESI